MMLHDGQGAGRLGFVRACAFGIAIITVATDSITEVSQLNPEFFYRRGILKVLPDSVFTAMLGQEFLRAFEIGLVIVLFLGMIGTPRFRAYSLLGALGFTIQQSLGRCVGFVNHADICLLFTLWILTAVPCTDGFSVHKRQRESAAHDIYANALVLITVVTLLGYVMIGAHRIAYSSPDIFLGDTMRFYLAQRLFLEDSLFWGLRLWVVEAPLIVLVMNAFFAFITLIEITSFFVIVSLRFRLVWLTVMVGFHFSTLILMNIIFWQNILLLMVLLIEPSLIETARQWVRSGGLRPTANRHAVADRKSETRIHDVR